MGVRSVTARASLFVVCVLLGFAVMIQLRTQNQIRQSAQSESATDQATIAGDLYDSNTVLRQQVDKLITQENAYDRSYVAGKQSEMLAEVDRLEAFNGVVPVSGPGVELSINASLRPVDVEDMLNEIRNTGAEAIAISGQRVVFNTAVSGTRGHVTVNGVVVQSPIIFDAIGAPNVLQPAIARKGGMLSYLRTSYPNSQMTLTTKPSLTLPAYSRQLPIRLSK